MLAHLMPAIFQKEPKNEIPKYEFPEKGMSPRAAYQLVHNQLSLDGNPLLNLASFVNTWMEPEADKPYHGKHQQKYHRCL